MNGKSVAIPYETIVETLDRSWTPRLLMWLGQSALDDAERRSVARALEQLEDPRAISPLVALLEDPERPDAVRRTARNVLHNAGLEVARERLLGWFRSADPVLQGAALLLLDHADAELIETVAADPVHPAHREAIATLAFGFEEPRFQTLKIAALRHPEAEVRQQAADVLFWDEPLAAEGPLIDSARCDPAPAVAEAAVNTLRYYRSRSALAAVAAARFHADAGVRQQAETSYDELRAWFRDEACSADGRLRAWMAPIWELAAFTPEELVPEPDEEPSPPAPRPPGPRLEADAIAALVAEPYGPWRERLKTLRALDWSAVCAGERASLAHLLTGHPDSVVRALAAVALSTWQMTDALLDLTRDPSFLVRRATTYHLASVPASGRVAGWAWEHLAGGGTTSIHAWETLATFVAHAGRSEAVSRLVELARHDWRDSLRTAAVDQLVRLQAYPEIVSLLDVLEEAPRVTWGVHLAVLRGCELKKAAVKIPPLVDEADNLDVQSVLARLRRG